MLQKLGKTIRLKNLFEIELQYQTSQNLLYDYFVWILIILIFIWYNFAFRKGWCVLIENIWDIPNPNHTILIYLPNSIFFWVQQGNAKSEDVYLNYFKKNQLKSMKFYQNAFLGVQLIPLNRLSFQLQFH